MKNWTKEELVVKAEEIRQEIRKKGRFGKYCADCGAIFASDDMDEFLKMMKDHRCTRYDLPDDYVQKDKLDWWKCKCGGFHKGFPYKCPK